MPHDSWYHISVYPICIDLAKEYLVFDDLPWTFRQFRSCRTLFAYGKKLNVPRVYSSKKHSALADAIAQAISIININKVLTEKGVPIL